MMKQENVRFYICLQSFSSCMLHLYNKVKQNLLRFVNFFPFFVGFIKNSGRFSI